MPVPRSNATKEICPKGHTIIKSSDWPVCPVCEQLKKLDEGFLSELSAPARRALLAAGIRTLSQLASNSESDILRLHGMGPASLPKLRMALAAVGLRFKK
jgi:DNA-directed RNA polymerase alpha subunit